MDLETLLKRKGAVGMDKLEELREEQEEDADNEQKRVEGRQFNQTSGIAGGGPQRFRKWQRGAQY